MKKWLYELLNQIKLIFCIVFGPTIEIMKKSPSILMATSHLTQIQKIKISMRRTTSLIKSKS